MCTLFDRLDKYRICIQGNWKTRDVWINGEKLTPSRIKTSHVGCETKPVLYNWGSHSEGAEWLCSDICNYVEKILNIPIVFRLFYTMLNSDLIRNLPLSDFSIAINTREYIVKNTSPLGY